MMSSDSWFAPLENIQDSFIQDQLVLARETHAVDFVAMHDSDLVAAGEQGTAVEGWLPSGAADKPRLG
jgi:hypothetical protein